MTDPVIPGEAVEAAARGMFAEEQCDKRQRQDVEGNWNSRLNDEDQAEYRSLATAALAAALPHLPARQIGDELAPELRQEIRTVMELGRALGKAEGRQEAAEEIAAELEEMVPLWMANTASMGDGIDQRRAAAIAREVATRTADARTDPSGHTDLPPTPDAGSKRLPEEGDEWCCGTCQRIAWEANPMSWEEQSTGETP